MNRLKNLTLNIALVVSSCVFILFMLEIGVRIFVSLTRPQMIVEKSSPQNAERKLRYGKPFFKAIFLSAEYTMKIQTNSEGFRDVEHELTKPPNVFRILIAGDSFTFGLGVEANQTYAKILEKILNGTNEHEIFRYEVFNMGIADIGTLEELEIIRYGIRYKPDLVLLGLFAENRWNPGNGNDLCDNLKFRHESEGKESIEYAPLGPFLKLKTKLTDYANFLQRFLAKHSKLYFLLMTRGGTTLRRHLIGFRENKNQHEIDISWDITKDALKKINTAAQEAGAQFVIIRIPFLYDVYNTKPDQVSRILAEFGRENSISICDLLKVLRQNKNKDLYYPADGHWKPIAHELAAREIYNYLAEYNFLHTHAE